MRYTNSSWFPIYNFCKMSCDRDWQVGAGMWSGVKDALTGGPIKKFETVFWNRRKGNLSVSLENYNKVKDNPKYENKLRELGLPKDIKIS